MPNAVKRHMETLGPDQPTIKPMQMPQAVAGFEDCGCRFHLRKKAEKQNIARPEAEIPENRAVQACTHPLAVA
jgi:hypothetical protein